MADAKVIPFDDDRSRGAGQRPPRRRTTVSRRKGDAATVREVKAVPAGRDGGAPGVDETKPGAAGGDSSEPSGRRPRRDGRARGEVSEADRAGERESVARQVPEPRGGGGGWDRRIAGGLAFLRRRLTGDYEVDEFGYDAELTDQVLMSLLRPIYDKYFRVEVKGIENVPSDGGALIVANHSGTLPWDGLMMQVAVHDHHPQQRHLRLLAADLVFMLPVVNELARKAGHTLACAEDAGALLERGELVGVMPEGFKGIGKPFGERYKLQRFGRGGFVSTALRTGSPIVPCSIVGAEEIYPMVGNAKTLARVLGIPYFPLTPTFPWLGPLGVVPLPTKWTIQFGEPIPTDGYPPEAAEDPMLMFNLTDQVREQIQHTLYKLLVQRRSVFF
ncbi:lysophospholipid acyltransferase family protein [Streptomyces spectabilis]|uniref:1-acyl-sn-glycerol-3-phosphate acyltransferase n=1 Tax=Streptomyces spectabilis TaxID=68270 RepID=A0A5P2XCI5_STRST|nr:lysophospholipid acyltransferase family protein [Streptomyces spectabilis]MBB5108053.1 1-acyl-sn-glycerol-3-phosphate acyltransferase [Streptomyces spectabilis]MCI3904279.1 acyltransferase family protein [Streptomyces spectabilis]QEV61394.1 acyltransferase family protein [Streptomyces spectabilis]GGV26245.1 glycerol acyltransferase [Streptomyces spectabilis]